MSTLNNKIDFVVLAAVRNANPNGDPLNGNRPRTTYDGFGEISDVCIKRKLRNRLQDEGEQIFVQSDDRADDGFSSLSDRVKNTLPEKLSKEDFAKKACETWFDVRAFGQVFAFKGAAPKEGVSVGVRGPVSIHQARSITPIDVSSIQITKSVNSETGDKKGADTMGMKHMVNFGLYEIKGSINVQLAEKTGFSEEDAEKVKECLRTLFVNDASSARPDGSMEVIGVYWWKHNNKMGQYSSAKVHRSLVIKEKDPSKIADSIDDYEIEIVPLEGLEPEYIEGI
ncbi:type I-C CRISPR-associated protein Cas7/Csd2 [Anaerovorax odorimutans]|uniref:Type I-C CRISPR-associated protein Cas7/Csd2 n=1 Tax=Anaerovorax odorimutans TaxID=109327 RepID=A0ABT1RLG7_9FIRM|nr:type I-C CRISPR-associated protein Cas7/Csd2 [Anaerovorax odorimutans]MCQ4636031.1 type I-C CRISPR-associated protein Cas7/Csd2 [Anaerovorax odorimutans]